MPLDDLSELRRRVPGGKYTLALVIAERARQLQNGAMPLAEVRLPNPLSVAMDEIAQGKISFQITNPELEASVDGADGAHGAGGTDDNQAAESTTEPAES
jgi:DNA-directed RNA polymerase subunit omega